MKLLDILDELFGLVQRTRWPDGGTCSDFPRQTSATKDTATEMEQQSMQCSSVSPLQLQQAAGSAVLWCLAAATTGNSCSGGTAAAQQLLRLQPVFSKLYAVEDVDMIDGIISGWELVASILAGAAQFAPNSADQLEASSSSFECLQAAPAVTNNSSSTLEGPSSSNPAPQQELQQQLQRLLQWDPSLVQAVVALLHHYTASTGLQPLQQHASSKGLQALLLLLCFHGQATQDSNACSQLLALACGRTVPHTPAAIGGRGAGHQQPLEAISGLPAAVPLTDAFHITVPLVQLASTSTHLHPAWSMPSPTSSISSRDDQEGSEAQQLLSQQEQVAALSAAAGQCLVAAFCPAQGSSAQDCPLSAAMVLLVYQLFQGPGSDGTAATAAAGSNGNSRAGDLPPVAEGPRVALTKAQQAAHRDWLATPPVAALAPLAAAYPHPQLLMRALLALVLPAASASTPPGVPNPPAGVPAPAAGSGVGQGGSEGTGPPAVAAGAARRSGEAARELAAFAQACRVLQAVYAPRGSCQQQAGLLRQLLVALADPLGPAANCSVAVRCAALRHMEAAVDGYLQECAGLEPDASLQLQQQLWGEMTLGALLFALRWDGAVRVRRAAVQLLQRVALPLQGDMVGQLAALLADKCSDRDVQVRVAALELLVQLPLHVLLRHLQEGHWWRLLQAGIALAPPAEQPGGQEERLVSSEECSVALVRLLQEVLQMSPAPAGPAACIPVWRVQQLITVLLLEPAVSQHVARLMSHWQAAAA